MIQSILSRMLMAILCGVVAMNFYLLAIEPGQPFDQRGVIYTIVVGICIYLIVYSVLSKLGSSQNDNNL